MKINPKIAGTVFFLVTLTICLAEDEKISLTQAPEAVQKAIKEHAGSNKIVHIEKVDEDGKFQYEALTKSLDGRKTEYVIGTDGSLLATEEQIKLEDLPPRVAETAKKTLADNSIKTIEKVTKDGKVTYEVGYKGDGKKMEAVISPDGTLIKNGEDKD